MGIIIKPLVTEKMTAITDKLNRFGFVVPVSYTHLDGVQGWFVIQLG